MKLLQNRLKDSDVTWLYGPLHTKAVDPVPKPKSSAAEDRLGLEKGVSAKARGKTTASVESKSPKRSSPTTTHPPKNSNHRSDMVPKKPILKYRSLSDILTVPSMKRPRHDSFDDHESGVSTPTGSAYGNEAASTTPPSETASVRSFMDNPPQHMKSPTMEDAVYVSDGNQSTTDPTQTSGDEKQGGRRKHIAFNHRVEQCIAVDSDEDRERYNNKSRLSSAVPKWGARLHRPKARTGSFFQNRGSDSEDDSGVASDSSDEDEEEAVLTFRSSRSHAHPGHSVPFPSPPSNSEHYTIAKLAPTILKNSESLPSPSPAVVYDVGPNAVSSFGGSSDTDEEADSQSATPIGHASHNSALQFAQQVSAGGRRHVIVPQHNASTYNPNHTHADHVVRSNWADNDQDYSSVGLEYHSAGAIDAADGDFNLTESAYSAGDSPYSGSSSLYADYDPVPRGHFSHSAQSPPMSAANLPKVESQAGKLPVPVAAATTRSILKPRTRTASDSSSSSNSTGDMQPPAAPSLSPSLGSSSQAETENPQDLGEQSRGRSISRGSSSSSLEARSRSSGASGGSSSSPINTILPQSRASRTTTPKRREDPGGSYSNSNSESETTAEIVPPVAGKDSGEGVKRHSTHPVSQGASSSLLGAQLREGAAKEAHDMGNAKGTPKRQRFDHGRSPSHDSISPKSKSAQPITSSPSSEPDYDSRESGHRKSRSSSSLPLEDDSGSGSAARTALLRSTGSYTDSPGSSGSSSATLADDEQTSSVASASTGSPLRNADPVTAAKDVVSLLSFKLL